MDVFTDAAGSDAHLAAVVVSQGRFWYTHSAAGEEVLEGLLVREDKQICALAMYAVVLALLSFAPWFRGARLRIWADNTCAEKMLFRGSGRAPDHNRIAHFVWTWALEHRCSL